MKQAKNNDTNINTYLLVSFVIFRLFRIFSCLIIPTLPLEIEVR